MLALAAHAVAVELVASAWSGTVIAAVVLLAALGAAGLLGWQSPVAVAIPARHGAGPGLHPAGPARRGLRLLPALAVRGRGGVPAGHPGRSGRVVGVRDPRHLPRARAARRCRRAVPVALVRAVSLVFIGLVVHAAVEAFRDSVAARADALAMLDTFGDATPVGLAFWDRDLRFRRVNPTFAEMSGWPMRDLLGRQVGEVPMPVPELVHHLQRVREGHQAPPLEVHCAGRWWTLQLFPMLGTQRQIGVGAVAVDISDQRESARALAHSATHDSLTGLPNRALLRDRLEVAVARAARRGEPIAVLFCDLDRFKEVNDSLGHAAGDELLRVAADRLRRAVRDGDTVARLGGDEFAVLCAEIDGDQAAVEVAERVRARCGPRCGSVAASCRRTMSIGVTVGVPAPGDAEQLLADADVAMYGAKDLGRDRVLVFDMGQRAGAQRRFEFHAALRAAVERQELSVAYQPIFDMDGQGGRCRGARPVGTRWQPGGPSRVRPDRRGPRAHRRARPAGDDARGGGCAAVAHHAVARSQARGQRLATPARGGRLRERPRRDPGGHRAAGRRAAGRGHRERADERRARRRRAARGAARPGRPDRAGRLRYRLQLAR